MAKRSYQQGCALAQALDGIGERWTLLILRELLLAPQRYNALLDALPGIGTNLLAERLKSLEALGIATKVDAPDGRHHVYQLTKAGHALEPAVLELIRWGLRYAPTPSEPLTHRDHWDLLAARALFQPRSPVPEGDYALDVGASLTATVRGGELHVAPGAPASAIAAIATDKQTLVDLARGETDIESSLATGAVHIQGDQAAAIALLAGFRLADDDRP